MSCLLKNPPAASQLVSKGCVRSVSVQRVLAENAFPPGFRRYVELSPSGLVLVGAEVPSLVLGCEHRCPAGPAQHPESLQSHEHP